jgi:hypothetical protein
MGKKVKIHNKTKRTDFELQQASKHLFWEMRYLSERFEFLLRFIGSKREDEMGGIITSIGDSFLIHGRKMVEFLFNESSDLYDDDVVAEDYFSTADMWRDLRPKQSDVIRKTKEQIGKLLAHFTYKVVDNSEGRISWEVSEVYIEIFQTLQLFLKTAPRSLLDENLNLLREDNPNIIVCHPIYPPIAKAPYRIRTVRDKASGFDISEDNG